MPDPTGRKLLTLAARHIGQRYILGARVPKDNANWTGPWDCAEFTSWLVYQVSGTLYGCLSNRAAPSTADAYTGYWGRDALALGKKVAAEEAAATEGAFVLRLPSAELGGHIVVSDGVGGTVEAHSAKRGVIRGTLTGRRWDMGILPPSIHYREGAPVAPIPAPALLFRVTDPLTKGPDVRKIQRKLKDLGFNPGPIDGIYGAMTARAAAAFQMQKGLLADGEVGPTTWRALGL